MKMFLLATGALLAASAAPAFAQDADTSAPAMSAPSDAAVFTVYGKLAYVNGQIRSKFGDGVEYAGGHADRDGARAGAGAEFAVTKHAYVKAEYDYTRFKSFHADDLGVTDTSLRYDRNQVLAGFGVHF